MDNEYYAFPFGADPKSLNTPGLMTSSASDGRKRMITGINTIIRAPIDRRVHTVGEDIFVS
jgi:hypothetical protein